MIRGAALAVILALAAGAAARADEAAVTIPTRPGVTQSFLFEAPASPKASVILLSGGLGVIGIHVKDGKASLDEDRNFLVRSRELFAQQGLNVATLDTPSDRSDGMDGSFRTGAANAQDIGAVAVWLKQEAPLPVWLVGTSMGTVSEANAAVRLGGAIDGLVLTSSVIASGKNKESSGVGSGVLSFDLERIAVPVLMVAHREDSCSVSPPSGAQQILMKLTDSPRTAVRMIDGGTAPRSAACQALSRHGYIGVEDQVVSIIASFILAK